MVLDNISNVASAFPSEVVSQINFLTTTLQALGGIIILYLIFNIINVIINRRRNKKIDDVSKEINKINNNLLDIKKFLQRNKK